MNLDKQLIGLRAGGGQAQYQNRHTDTEIAWFGSEASELVGAKAHPSLT